jgi:hypothetical protein
VSRHQSSAIAKQHADFFRKVLLRKKLLRWVGETEGAAYVPFCGDGDLAVELYSDRHVFAADIDADRVATAAYRLPTAEVRVADCDPWVFPGLKAPFAVADFDAYAFPYTSFRNFWAKAEKADRIAMFFTDGQGMNITFKGRWRTPDGIVREATGFKAGVSAGLQNERRYAWTFWYSKHVMPWLEDFIGPEWRILDRFRYVRGIMLYWGVALERR